MEKDLYVCVCGRRDVRACISHNSKYTLCFVVDVDVVAAADTPALSWSSVVYNTVCEADRDTADDDTTHNHATHPC